MLRESREKYFILIGVSVALLPILLWRDFTPSNELRYLGIADEALRNHTLFTFSNHGVPYADKPPLYLWGIMLCRRLTGEHQMWLLSLFSLLPAWGIVRIMDLWTREEMTDESRMTARWMLLTCGLFTGAAVTLRMDMLMSFFIVLALRTFWRMLTGEGCRKRDRWLFPLYLFLALFTKGPVGLLIPLCATAVYLGFRKRLGEMGRYWGLRTWGVLLVGCALWFSGVYAEGGADYLHNLLFHQTVGRAVNSFHHAEPFYYYILCLWYCLAPWSLVVVGVVAAVLRPKMVRSNLQCFFLVVGITTFVLLSCFSSKLQIYLLPAVPFMVYATGMFLPRFRDDRWLRVALAVPSAVFTLVLPLLLIGVATHRLPDLPWLVFAAAAFLTLCGLRSVWSLYGRKRTEGVARPVRFLATGLLCALFVAAWSLPSLNAYIGYGALCRKAADMAAERGIRDIRTWHLSRSENLDVYFRFPVKNEEGDTLPARTGRPYLLLIRQRDLEHFSGMDVQRVGPYAVVVVGDFSGK